MMFVKLSALQMRPYCEFEPILLYRMVKDCGIVDGLRSVAATDGGEASPKRRRMEPEVVKSVVTSFREVLEDNFDDLEDVTDTEMETTNPDTLYDEIVSARARAEQEAAAIVKAQDLRLAIVEAWVFKNTLLVGEDSPTCRAVPHQQEDLGHEWPGHGSGER